MNEELRNIYNKIYKSVNARHPQRGLLKPYGSDGLRDGVFINYLIEHFLPRNTTVLDASCGRAHLLRTLLNLGFIAEGTEISSYLVNNELKDLPVHLAAYDELDSLGKKYDVVISNDVLEHMPDEESVFEAMKSLCDISNKHVLICVCTNRGARNWPTALNLKIQDLHLVNRSAEWWKKVIDRYIKVDDDFEVFRKDRVIRLYSFGTKKCIQ